VTIGLDDEGVRHVFQEALVRIAGEKGIPLAPLQDVLAKLGEKGIRYEDIPKRLEAAADELVKLREESSRFEVQEFSQAGATIGLQLNGNSQIGTFVRGIDATTANKISETLADVSKTLASIHKGADKHQHSVEKDPVFQEALSTAQRMYEAGQAMEASRCFIDALESEARLERERQEDRQRLRLRLLEEGIVYDKRVPDGEAALAKLRLIAELVHPGDREAQAKYLEHRASKYQQLGTVRGDNSALHVAVSVFSWLAKGTINVDR
jgi:hypothetical protein